MLESKGLLDEIQDLRILYVEDNIDTREMTQILLEDFFDEIVVAVDGEDGYEKFINNDIDLIITDINMPKMNGLEMAQKIKNVDIDVPILIFSAYSDADNFVKAIKVGVDGYLVKPIDIMQFQQTLTKCTKDIKLKKENEEYKALLETKVQKQIEILRHKDKILLEQAKFVAMGEMIDIIAHQWKQPLNTIVMNASMLNYALKKEPNIQKEDFIECYDNLNIQVDSLLSTLDEFRNFFRPTSDAKETSLKEIITSTLLLLKDELISNQIEIQSQCASDLFIKVNANDIKQLIINIVTNAKDEIVKSNLEADNRNIEILCTLEDDAIVIKIKNSGDGIKEDILDKIFEMNFTTKDEIGGTGIGLYMCALICEKYGANIKASNDNGAVFTVTFPRQ